jgi:predicted ATPase/DNA-binding winged helix-turn-helix (wHTH) protein
VHASIRFSNVEVRPAERVVLVGGRPSAIGARAFDLLLALIEHRDRVVSKNELFDRVWPGVVVEENNLQVQISALRKLLGQQTIVTVPGRGYRFSATLDGAPAGEHPAGPAAAKPDTGARAAAITNLPKNLPPLYGRDADIERLRRLVESNRLITVVGAGGIGKSRLAQAAALALAERWTEGTWMVELAGLTDPVLLPNAVARVLGIKLTGQAAAQDELVAALAERNLLLVLDNCEHLLEASATLAQATQEAAANVTVMVTSQEPLHLPAEQQYRVMPLAVPSDAAVENVREFGAVALFEARVRAADPRFSLNSETLPLVIDICRRLDGLPLAIELAAARVATLGLRPVRDKLDARFKLLTGGSRATLRRHQTLHATLEWSHHLLNPAEQAVFRRLGVFAGGFTVDLAQAVAGDRALDEWAVLENLSALVDKSLVVVNTGDPPRYSLLETARAFALEQLAAAEMAETLKRHALAMRAFVEDVDRVNLDGLMLTEQLQALLVPESDNLRAAYEWAVGDGDDIETATALAAGASALEEFAVECAEWLVPLRQRVESAELPAPVAARYWRAIAAGTMVGRVPRAWQAQAAERAHALYEKLGDDRRMFSSLTQLAAHRLAQNDLDAAQRAADAARSLMRPHWPAMLRARSLRIDGKLARSDGRLSEALALHRDDVRVSASSGDWLLEVMARGVLVDLLWQTGPIEEAAGEANHMVAELRRKPVNAWDMVVWFATLVGILSDARRIDEASRVALETLPLLRRAKNCDFEVWIRFSHLLSRRGQVEAAALLLSAAEAMRSRAGVPLAANEQRLVADIDAALAATLSADARAAHRGAGAALGDDQVMALLAEALKQPNSRDGGVGSANR